MYRREQPARFDHRRRRLEGCATCGKLAPRRSSKRPGAAKSLGSFTLRYEIRRSKNPIGWGGFKVLDEVCIASVNATS